MKSWRSSAQFLIGEQIDFEQEDFEANMDYLRRFIMREVYVSAFDIEEGQKVYYELDPDVQRAVSLLPRARQLLEEEASQVAFGGTAP